MFKKNIFFLTSTFYILIYEILITLSNSLFAHSVLPDNFNEQYTLSVCAIFKNEAKYLKEWIEYHRLAGVDHFYLYNNNSTDHFRVVLEPYVKAQLVTLVNWPDRLGHLEEPQLFKWALSTQISAYENAIVLYGHETKWLTFLNIDEFLISPTENNLRDILFTYEDYAGIVLKSDFFDANPLGSVPKKKLVIEALELIAAPHFHPEIRVEKVIFKPTACIGFTWPPYQCKLSSSEKIIALRKTQLKINYYANRFIHSLDVLAIRDKLSLDNRALSEYELTEILEYGYKIEDQERSIYRFIPEILKKLGYIDW